MKKFLKTIVVKDKNSGGFWRGIMTMTVCIAQILAVLNRYKKPQGDGTYSKEINKEEFQLFLIYKYK